MFTIFTNLLEKFSNVFATTGEYTAKDIEFIQNEIYQFFNSKKRADMMTGERYYVNNHDILQRKIMAIGEGGELQEVKHLPNNKVIDNQYAKMVDQKNNYLLGKPPTFKSENEEYTEKINLIFGPSFLRTLKAIGEDSLNCGLGWLYIHYDDNGDLAFKRIRPHELIPIWRDAEHTILEMAIRVYPVLHHQDNQEKVIYKVEVFDKTGISYFEYDDAFKPAEPYHADYFTVNDGETANGYNWSKIPLVAFKYNNKETPLINRVKSLQDGINVMLSDFENNMQENANNTILVLKNYEGENLGEFRRNLATFRAINIHASSEGGGGVDTLKIDVNPDNYQLILAYLKKALIENAMGYDAKDDRMAGNPNQMNIQSMYSDIDLDANGTEVEYKAAMEQVIWFVNSHLANTGQGDFTGENVDIIFNRDVLINESEAIANLRQSVGLLSTETIIAQHPFVTDPQAELERLKKEQLEAMKMMDYQDLGAE